MWLELLKFVGGGAVLLAVVAWLIRSLILHLLTKDIEKYKFDLKRDADKELEAIKASLNIEALTHQIEFSKLHDRRADLIEQLYKKVITLENAAACLKAEFQMDDHEELKEKADTFIDRFFELHSFVEDHKIYFSEHLANKIKELNTLYFNLSIDIYYQSKPDNKKDFVEAFNKEKENFDTQNTKIKTVIESDFRKLIGVKG